MLFRSDIVPLVRRLVGDPAEHAAMRLASITLAIPDATKRIVHEITRKLESGNSDFTPSPAPVTKIL